MSGIIPNPLRLAFPDMRALSSRVVLMSVKLFSFFNSLIPKT